MALVTKMIRCAVCGSSDVKYDRTQYHCAACGAHRDRPMPAADLADINRIMVLGDKDGRLAELRRRYPQLDITNWSREKRLENR